MKTIQDVEKKIEEIEKELERKDDGYYQLYMDEKKDHRHTKVIRNIFLAFALVSTALFVALLLYFSTCTIGVPMTYENVLVDSEDGGNAVYTSGTENEVNIYGESGGNNN